MVFMYSFYLNIYLKNIYLIHLSFISLTTLSGSMAAVGTLELRWDCATLFSI